MDYTELSQQIEDGISIHKLADYHNKAPATIRYWLQKYSLKTRNLSFGQGYNKTKQSTTSTDTTKYCPACDTWKLHSEFYTRRARKDSLMGWCRVCSKQSALKRQHEVKQQAVEYKGGCCQKCGYAKYIGALDFHHLDPASKDPSWAVMKTSSLKTLKPELDKCILLCANCHRETHALQRSVN